MTDWASYTTSCHSEQDSTKIVLFPVYVGMNRSYSALEDYTLPRKCGEESLYLSSYLDIAGHTKGLDNQAL